MCDAQRFPDRNTVNELLAFNRAYRRHLDSRQALEQDRSHNWLFARGRRTISIKSGIRFATPAATTITSRSAGSVLKRLRQMVGPEAYNTADLPPYVPLWRFQDIN